MNNSFRITCCSTADMPAAYLASHHIPYACFHFRMDGREYEDDLGASISLEEFYKKVHEGAMPVTSQVNPGQYEAMFEPILEAGMDIIHLCLSSGISGTYNSALIARDEMSERYPERRITVIDTLCASIGFGFLLDAAWERMEAGMDYDSLVSWIEEHRHHVHHWFFTSDLSHLKRGGRISPSAAFFGSMLNICPLMTVDAEGKLALQDKCRGKKKVMKEMISRMKTYADGGADYSGKCFIAHSACPEDARALSEMAKNEFPNMPEEPFIADIGTVIGSHTGPGTVVLIFWGEKR